MYPVSDFIAIQCPSEISVANYVNQQCGNCFYCRRGNSLLCENFNACGVTQDGGFAEYIL